MSKRADFTGMGVDVDVHVDADLDVICRYISNVCEYACMWVYVGVCECVFVCIGIYQCVCVGVCPRIPPYLHPYIPSWIQCGGILSRSSIPHAPVNIPNSSSDPIPFD